MRLCNCGPVAALLIVAGIIQAGDACGDGQSLLHAHLSQAIAIAPNNDKPGSDALLKQLKAEIAAKRAAWSQILDKNADADDLLAGISQATREKASTVAADPVAAKAALKGGVTLEFVLALAAYRNAEVRSAHQNWRATLNRFDQASYLEDLVAQYRSFVRELDTLVGPQSHKEMPSKTFAFPSVLALKGQAIDLEAEIARLNYQQTMRKSINDAARAYFDVQFAIRAITVTKENRALIAQMESITGEQLKVGTANQADALKAQSMLAMLDTKLVTYERQRLNAVSQVNALLALAPDVEWGAVAEANLVDENIGIDEILRRVSAGSQELRKAAKDAELMPVMVRMAETMLYVRASGGASQIAPSVGAEAGPTRKDMAAFPTMREVNAEPAGFGANAAYIDELRIRVKQAQAMLDDAAARTAYTAKDAHFRTDVSRRETKTLSEQVVPKAKQVFEASRDRYSSAKGAFIEFLDAGRSQVDAVLLLDEARRDLNKGLADLQDATGTTVSRLLAAPKK